MRMQSSFDEYISQVFRSSLRWSLHKRGKERMIVNLARVGKSLGALMFRKWKFRVFFKIIFRFRKRIK